MNDLAKNLKNTIIQRDYITAQFIHSFFHTPGATARSIFRVVVRAGQLSAAPNYRIERSVSPSLDGGRQAPQNSSAR